MALDTQIMLALHKSAARSRTSRGVTRFVATYVPVVMVLGYAAALWFSPEGPSSTHIADFVFAVVTALVSRFAIGSLIRGAVRRPRPYVTHHLQPLINLRSYSFPSAHALFFFAFSGAVFAVMPWLGALFFVLTIGVCVARIGAGIHYPSDMLAGAVVGIVTAFLMVAYIAPLTGVPL